MSLTVPKFPLWPLGSIWTVTNFQMLYVKMLSLALLVCGWNLVRTKLLEQLACQCKELQETSLYNRSDTIDFWHSTSSLSQKYKKNRLAFFCDFNVCFLYKLEIGHTITTAKTFQNLKQGLI